ncbi:MAG: energy-coupling factor transporter transmembrane protein EcfT [Clostridiales bacterium]|nr:energy-coupling factor transporter transmembrane protein EcfT [Clostridiales bacterium]
MIRDITLGQYFPGNSPLHRLDPRAKILLLIALLVLIFLCSNFYSLAAVFVIIFSLIGISRISFRTVLRSIRPVIYIVIFTAVLNLFYGDGEVLVQVWRLTITDDGVYSAIFMAVRIICLVVSGSLLTYTTSPTALTSGIESLLKPLTVFKLDVHTFAMIMTIALRFIPTLIEETDKIMSAQKSRGADLESGNLIQRARALIPILIPLFISAFRRAGELAYAMECRCYRGGGGRTKMKRMHMSWMDGAATLVVIAFYAGILLLNTVPEPSLAAILS